MLEIAVKSDVRVLTKQSINLKKKGKIMVQNPLFLINIRKNINANNPGYGKYYPKAVEKETITLRGLAKHMSEHQCVYSRDIIEGVLIKMASCMIELIAQGMRRGIKTKTPPGADRWGFCGAYEIRTRDLLRDRQAF